MALVVQSKVSPKDLAINRRYRNSQTLVQEVRDAIANLAADVTEKALYSGFLPSRESTVQIVFFFPDMRNDLDGPLKHTLDALQDGLRQAGHPKWNDRSIREMHIKRGKGDGVRIIMYEWKGDRETNYHGRGDD